MASIYTLEQYKALTKSIALGVMEVNYGNKKVTYRSLNDMLRIQSAMQADLGISTFNSRKRFVQHTKGLK